MDINTNSLLPKNDYESISKAMDEFDRLVAKEVEKYTEVGKERFLMDMASVKYNTLNKGVKEGIEKGIEQGMQQGIKQGVEKGVEQGIEQGIEQALKRALSRKKSKLQKIC